MGLSIINPISDTRWDSFVDKHPESTIFHHSVWAKVLHERYGGDPTYYVEEDDKGNILAGIPFVHIESHLTGKRLVSLPASEYCYPLGYSSDSITRLLEAAKGEVINKRVSFLEFRGWSSSIAPEKLGLCESPHYARHVMNLSANTSSLRAKLESDYHLKRNLRRAEKSGLAVREARDEEDIREFHKLTVVTRRRLCLLPWPYKFLESIYRHIVLSGHGFLILAELDDKIVAGSMYFTFNDTVLLKFNASGREYSQYRPNYIITWKAIERSSKDGYKSFDFGITETDNPGLLSFKRQWATEETPLHYYYYPAVRGVRSLRQNGPVYKAYRTFNRLAPGAVLGAAARIMYKHLG